MFALKANNAEIPMGYVIVNALRMHNSQRPVVNVLEMGSPGIHRTSGSIALRPTSVLIVACHNKNVRSNVRFGRFGAIKGVKSSAIH